MSVQKFQNTIEFQLTFILIKDHGLEDSEQMEQV